MTESSWTVINNRDQDGGDRVSPVSSGFLFFLFQPSSGGYRSGGVDLVVTIKKGVFFLSYRSKISRVDVTRESKGEYLLTK